MKTKVAVVLVALLLILVIVLFCQIFNVRNVEIIAEGSLPQSEEELLRKSGIELNTSIFSLSKEEIRERVENAYPERSVAVERIEKVFPNTVRLYVRQRKPIVAVALSDQTGVVPTDRDFQLTEIKDFNDIDYGSIIAVTGTSVVNSFDTNELIFLRRVVYAFFRSGFTETSLVSFLKEFRFDDDGIHAVLRTERNAEFLLPKGNASYESVVRTVSETYQNYLATPEKERGGNRYTDFGVTAIA